MADLPRLILSAEQSRVLDGVSFRYLYLHKFLVVSPMESVDRTTELRMEICPYAVVGANLLVFDRPQAKTLVVPDLPTFLNSSTDVAVAFFTQPFLSAICAAIHDQIPAWDSVAVEGIE